MQPSGAERLSGFLSDEAEFKITYGLHSTEEAVSEDAWRNASDDDHYLTLEGFPGQRTISTECERTYLPAVWKPAFGGQLRVVHLDGLETTVEAENITMIVFNVHTHAAHIVEPYAASTSRPSAPITIGGWYHRAPESRAA